MRSEDIRFIAASYDYCVGDRIRVRIGWNTVIGLIVEISASHKQISVQLDDGRVYKNIERE